MNKKGMELSMTVIVLLIISVIIFILAIGMITNWFGKAEELKGELDRQTEEQINSALSQGNSLVVIPISIKEVKRGDSAAFGIGVKNIGSEKQFSISLGFSGGYSPEGKEYNNIDEVYVEDNWLGTFKEVAPFQLSKNQIEPVPVVVRADNNVAQGITTPKGDYVFNVCVWEGQAQECDINMLNQVYSNRIYQVTLRVL
ncbi:hypothetical protein KY329_00495 [Candidatus Woesearchaeota archaeon]|nr:hypothetical protein [Candidatus Woesearchaeota archaeon]